MDRSGRVNPHQTRFGRDERQTSIKAFVTINAAILSQIPGNFTVIAGIGKDFFYQLYLIGKEGMKSNGVLHGLGCVMKLLIHGISQ
jgi:hypothetical protein